MHTELDWMKVRTLAVRMGARSDRAIALATGIHRNSIGREGAFQSTTLDALALFLDVPPTDLIKVVIDDSNKQTS